MKKALITGISGQDGSYLAEMLLAKGYEVHGIVRRSSSLNTARIDGIYIYVETVRRFCDNAVPDTVLHLAARVGGIKVCFH